MKIRAFSIPTRFSEPLATLLVSVLLVACQAQVTISGKRPDWVQPPAESTQEHEQAQPEPDATPAPEPETPETEPTPGPTPAVELPLPPGSLGSMRAVLDRVDRHYGGRGELAKARPPRLACPVLSLVPAPSSFGVAIQNAIRSNLIPQAEPVTKDIRSTFGLPALGGAPASLGTHELCEIQSAEMKSILRHPVDEAVLGQMNRFARAHNAARARWKKSASVPERQQGLADLEAIWAGFMGCLGYVESLSSPDGASSDRVARGLGVTDRPQGVLFYIDPLQQSAASRHNIGIFQFSPYSSGNLQSCIVNWNRLAPLCTISTRATMAETLAFVAEPSQNFNAFCGVNKLVQMFFVEANTTRIDNTPRANWRFEGLLPPAERCVSPFLPSKRSYSHYGPLQNTTGRNLAELMRCVDASLEGRL